MGSSPGEDYTAGRPASPFVPPELENQTRRSGRGTKRTRCLVITGVLLLCSLVLILALTLSPRKSGEDVWLLDADGVVHQLQCPEGFSRSPLILVSMDGFRAEYLKDHSSRLPVLSKLRQSGTTTPHLRPVYPSKTFPNHYSIVTGLYPESHGIVDNKMYDVTRNAFFSLRSAEKFNPEWYQGEPVWVTAMLQELRAATFFWPGSDVAINGTLPNFYKLYNKSIGFEKRVSTLLEWLSLPQGERADFYTLYVEEPDSSGHRHGPASTEVVQALEKVDKVVGLLMDGLMKRKLHKCVNIILLSDHGMEEATCEKAEFVADYLNDTGDFNVIQGPAARIRPTNLPENFFSFDYEGVVKNLSCRTTDQPMRPYLKENLPKRLHYASNVRIERAHLYMREGWQAALNREEVKYCKGGFHGSDNVFTSMQGIFIGYGPAFLSKAVVPPFENIEIYNLMCDLLNIRPAPNNGTHGSLNHLLRDPVHLPVHPAQLSHETPCEATGPVPADGLHCNCSSQTEAMVADMNLRLISLDSSVKAALRRLHHPFGAPAVVRPDVSFCLLYHLSYLSGFSRDRRMPLWVSYTVSPLTRVQPLSPEVEACVRADVRVPPAASQLCSRYRDDPALSYGLLHPPNLSTSGPETDSLITSNMAPMLPAFKDVWAHVHDTLVPKYSQQLNGVNVLSGPIFDENYDGHVDPLKAASGNEAPTPTHFFVILTSCGNSTFGPVNCEGPLQAKSFILPHRPDHTESCATGSNLTWVDDWLRLHTARVRDVELLTGLSFYHDRLSVEETLRLKTFLQTA